jgi:hypothetical protein
MTGDRATAQDDPGARRNRIANNGDESIEFFPASAEREADDVLELLFCRELLGGRA